MAIIKQANKQTSKHLISKKQTNMPRNTVTNEMVDMISKKANVANNITKADINEICNTLFDVIALTLREKDAVMINNTMKIKKVWRKERVYKNPKTLIESVKEAHYAVTISAMPGLKKLVESFSAPDESDEDKKSTDKTGSDSDDEDELVVDKKKAPVKKAPAKKAPAKKAPFKKAPVKKVPVVESDESDKEDKEDASDDEEPVITRKNPEKKTVVVESDDSDDE
jgi:nucleoid DNA-binding protein